MTEALEEAGFSIVSGLLDLPTAHGLISALTESHTAKSERGGEVFGRRNLLSVPAIHDLSRSPIICDPIRSALGDTAIAVRGIFFDKTPGANWPVAWHQDLSLAVDKRLDLPGWQGWSSKGGTVHVQPPEEILARMVTMRLHLDDCGAENGPLRVLPGTHRLGRLPRDRINVLRGEIDEHTCCASLGSALLMRPLLLHASSPAIRPIHRRVLHLEFAPRDLLPPGINWALN